MAAARTPGMTEMSLVIAEGELADLTPVGVLPSLPSLVAIGNAIEDISVLTGLPELRTVYTGAD